MAYQEIVAPVSAEAVIDAIRAFAESNGWAVSRNGLSGTSRTVTLKHPQCDYIHLQNPTPTQIDLCASIGYDGGSPPSESPGVSKIAPCNVLGGPYTKLYLFGAASPAPHIHVVLETATAGIYRFLSFGMIEKIEEFTGGTYYDCSNWSTSNSSSSGYAGGSNHAMFGEDVWGLHSGPGGGFRCDFAADARSEQWFYVSTSGYESDPFAHTGLSASGRGISRVLGECDDNAFSNRSVFHPTDLMVNRIGGYMSRVGSHPNVRLANIRKYTPGDEITIGSDVWVIFPLCRKKTAQLNTTSAPYDVHSDYFGYVFKKTV